jgi:phosphate transport system substrate-binding protein
MRPVLLGGCMVAVLVSDATAVEVDPALPDYLPVAALEGGMNSVGGDPLNNLMTFWAEGFQQWYPKVFVQIEGSGGSTAPAALIEGTAQLGPMVREMNAAEVAAFEKKWGYPPIAIKVAMDVLAVVVHPDNPIASLSLTQLDGVYSSSFKRGGADAVTWGDLGLTGEWTTASIAPYGRNVKSASHGFMWQTVLMRGTYKPSVQSMPATKALIEVVATQRHGLGYAGIGFLTPAVRAVPLSDGTQPPALPTHEMVLAEKYPLSRSLYVYIHKKPGADPLVSEFIRYVLSKQGQEIVAKDGLFPLTAAIAAEQRAKVAP